jgi:hypothetical protein
MSDDWNTRMDKLGAERGKWEDLEDVTKERTVTFDGTDAMAERVKLGFDTKWNEAHGGFQFTSFSLHGDFFSKVKEGDMLILDENGKAKGVVS